MSLMLETPGAIAAAIEISAIPRQAATCPSSAGPRAEAGCVAKSAPAWSD
jgi:hypothetical protein